LTRQNTRNHPRRGSTITVGPIRSRAAIKRIKNILRDKPRDLCLFTLGINTAYRASELLSIRVGQVIDLKPGDSINIKQSKTDMYRRVAVNATCVAAIQAYLTVTHLDEHDYLFKSRKGEVLKVSSLSRLVKKWCADAGLKGNYASHSLRKTWGYFQRTRNCTPVPLLMTAFGHSTQKQTLEYLGILPTEIEDIYKMEL